MLSSTGTQSRRRVKGVAERSNLETAAIESVATVRARAALNMLGLEAQIGSAQNFLPTHVAQNRDG